MYKIMIKKSMDSDWTTPSFPRSSKNREDLVDKAKELKSIYNEVGIKDMETGEVVSV